MNKAILIFAILLIVFVSIDGQEQKKERFGTYQEMRAQIGKLYQQKKYAETEEIL